MGEFRSMKGQQIRDMKHQEKVATTESKWNRGKMSDLSYVIPPSQIGIRYDLSEAWREDDPMCDLYELGFR